MSKLYIYAGVVLALCILGVVEHHRIFAEGAASRQADVDAANRKTEAESARANSYALSLQSADLATKAAEAQAESQRALAQQLIDESIKQKGLNAKAALGFEKRLAAAAKAPDCQTVLQATLCPAVMGY